MLRIPNYYILSVLLMFLFAFTSCTEGLSENLEQEIESKGKGEEANEDESESVSDEDVESDNRGNESENDDNVESGNAENDDDGQESENESEDYTFVKGYYEDFGNVASGYDGNLIELSLFTEGLDYVLNASNSLQVESTVPMGSGTFSIINIYSPQPGLPPTGEYKYDSEKEIWTFKEGFICTNCTTFNDSGVSSNFEGGLISITKIEANYTISLSFETENGETIKGYFSGALISADSLYEN